MGQPVKLSDGLVHDARMISQLTKRSMAGQIEFWAAIGRAIEPLLDGAVSMALTRAVAKVPLSKCMELASTPAGRKQLTSYLEALPYPHYTPVPGKPGLLLRTGANGEKTVGRFVRREFRPIKPAGK
jgi:hypothetical protein